MFGIGIPELIIILIVALLIVGPKALPQMAKDLGSAVKGFKRTADDFKETIEKEITLNDPSEEQSSRVGKRKDQANDFRR